jgi:hypothetical protein
MRTRVLTFIVAAALTPGALLLAPLSPAGASTNNATGNPTCNAGWNGTVTFTPALMTSGSASSDEVAVTATFNGCTGGSPVPASGSYQAKGVVRQAHANDCANWFAPPGPASKVITFATGARLTGDVQWTPSTINPSDVQFNSLKMTTGGAGRLTIRLPQTSTGLVTGSYPSTANLTLRIGQMFPTVAAACGSGLSSLMIIPMATPPNNSLSTGTW